MALCPSVIVLMLMLLGIISTSSIPLTRDHETTNDAMSKALRYMSEVPLIDGHNDWPWQLVSRIGNQLQSLNLSQELNPIWGQSYTDIPRLKEGRLGGQFWAAYTTCGSQYMDAVTHIMDQIDVILRMCDMYPDVFQFVTTADGILKAHRNGKIASLIGVEGGHNIDSSLATLRMLYRVGVRYMTVTHSCNTPWADNWLETEKKDPEFNGLSDWGRRVILEMNRLGMLVDLAHVSHKTMSDALDISVAPVIFSHSSAYAVCNNDRNVPDYILKRMVKNEGVVMVNFYTEYINCPPGDISDDRNYATLSQVADHMDHIKSICGWQCVGVGSDFDGVPSMPEGLEDVSKFPNLIAELIRRGWTEKEVKAAMGNNLLRVLRRAEQVRDEMSSTLPDETRIPIHSRHEKDNKCRTVYYWPQLVHIRAKRDSNFDDQMTQVDGCY
ncbi:dipeptidase 1-like [Lytechinus pictus]|uniref:dipeptidase 1-like n=1 Tax=Lytechinus pictus TaxID=7653 RepID=UPI0030BA22A2